MIENSEQFLALVAKDDDESKIMLRQAEASEDVWRKIIEAHPELVRAVTLNKTLPEGILWQLACHESTAVRTDIANKRALPEGIFAQLAADRDESVRARVAWNKNVPLTLLKILAKDTEEIVFEPARARLTKLGENW